MRRNEDIAGELARRLNETTLAPFWAEGPEVRVGSESAYWSIRIIDAGTGRPDRVRQAVDQAKTIAGTVVAASHFTPAGLEAVRDAGVGYMDDRYLHVTLEQPKLAVHLERGEEPVSIAREGNVVLAGAAGAVAVALLEDPERVWRVTEIADAMHVAPATAHGVLVGLEAEGLVERVGRGPATRRRVLDPGALLDRYAGDAANDRRVMARAFVLDDGPPRTLAAMDDGLKGGNITFAFTGACAAALMAPHVTAVARYEVWITSAHTIGHVLASAAAAPVEQGANVTFLRGPGGVLASANRDHHVRLASKFRVYADLLCDPTRGEEQAEYLRERVIGF